MGNGGTMLRGLLRGFRLFMDGLTGPGAAPPPRPAVPGAPTVPPPRVPVVPVPPVLPPREPPVLPPVDPPVLPPVDPPVREPPLPVEPPVDPPPVDPPPVDPPPVDPPVDPPRVWLGSTKEFEKDAKWNNPEPLEAGDRSSAMGFSRMIGDDRCMLGMGATRPRTSRGYTATFARLQASIVTVSSARASLVSGKPAVSMMTVLRPGTPSRPLARPLRASSTERTPKSAAALFILGIPLPADPLPAPSSVVETVAVLTPLTTAFRRSGSLVKFCVILRLPVKLAIAMYLLGPVLLSMNLAAASRA